MPILVVVPTDGEREHLLRGLGERGYPADRSTRGRLPVHHIPLLHATVATGGLGKTQFAVQTQHLLDSAAWDLVLCAGAAGALSDDLVIGDVVIASETIEHDIRSFSRALTPRFPASDDVLARCRAVVRNIADFQVRFGPVASGDEDIFDDDRRSTVRLATGAIAVAWEGAGGARACAFSAVPFLEVRGITDVANSFAPEDFRTHIPTAMAHVALVLERLARGAVA